MATDARLSQLPVEVVEVAAAPTARLSRESLEIVVPGPAPTASVSQVAIEIVWISSSSRLGLLGVG